MTLRNKKVLAGLALVMLVTAVGLISFKRRDAARRNAELLPYQARVSALAAVEQLRFAQIRTAIRTVEQMRATSKSWPRQFTTPQMKWQQRGQGLYVNYLGLPDEPTQLRWLVLFIEPEPTALKELAPPEDEEHHTLADGTSLHVSIWTAPNEGAAPNVILPFPAAEQWTQRLMLK